VTHAASIAHANVPTAAARRSRRTSLKGSELTGLFLEVQLIDLWRMGSRTQRTLSTAYVGSWRSMRIYE
jgi:hypothetical protein